LLPVETLEKNTPFEMPVPDESAVWKMTLAGVAMGGVGVGVEDDVVVVPVLTVVTGAACATPGMRRKPNAAADRAHIGLMTTLQCRRIGMTRP
jgi:hypothetical protein